MTELDRNSRRYQEPVVQSGKKLGLADQQQVGDGRGVEDGFHRPESLRKVSISFSRSSSV
jgi:hypothetical protein